MVDYQIALYNSVKDKLNKDNIQDFIDITAQLSNTETSMSDKVNLLHTYLTKIGVNIMDIVLEINPEIVEALQEMFQKPPFVNNGIPLVEQDYVNDKNKKTILSYIIQTGSYEIDSDKLYSITNIGDDAIKTFVTEFNAIIQNKNISSIVTFALTNAADNFISERKEEGYKELTLPLRIYNSLTNQSNLNKVNVQTYVDNYNEIFASSTDAELYTNIMNTIASVTDTQLKQNNTIASSNENTVLNVYWKQPLSIKKSEKMPIPSNVETIEGFYSSFESEQNVDPVKSKITEDIYKKWNSKLIDIFNNVIVFETTSYQFYKKFSQLLNDTNLNDFCKEEYPNDGIDIPQLSKEQPAYLLEKLKNTKMQNGTTIGKLIDSVVTNHDKDGKIITSEKHALYVGEVKQIITTMLNTLNNAAQRNKDIVQLLRSPIKLDQSGKETVSLQSLLSTISSPNNVAILLKSKNFGTSFEGASNLLEGILHDIRSIIAKTGTDDTCNIKESCTVEDFITNGLQKLFETDYQNVDAINQFGKNENIWEKPCSGYIAINTLYYALSNVTSSDEFLIILYTTMIPNAFVKIEQ